MLSLLVLCVAGTSFARAHAYVVATSPAAGSHVLAPPTRVTVTFDEPVSVESSDALVVRARDGTTFACAGGARIDPQDATRVVCTLHAPLPRGVYTVSWRATSADSHVVHGSFSFGVASAAGVTAGATSSTFDPSGPLATLLRWLVIMGCVAFAGGIAFERIVQRCEAARTLTGWGLAVAAAASVLALDVQAAAATGTDPLRALPSLGTLAFGSTWGKLWLVRMGCLALVAATYRRAAGFPAAAAAAAVVLFAASMGASGHALASGPPGAVGLAVFSDALHLLAAAVWTAGVLVLATGTVTSPAAIRRFTAVATACVVTLILTGVIASIIHAGSVTALAGDTYGRIILAKSALLVPLVALGYRNARCARSAVSDPDVVAAARVEAALLVIVLLLAAVLAGVPLPHPSA